MADAHPLRFACEACGETHDVEALVANEPEQWHLLTAAERRRSSLTADQCVIESTNGKSLYLRANLEIPVRGTDRVFTWGVWCSLSERSFDEAARHWDDPRRVHLDPHFGWLCTRIPTYPDTIYLKTLVHHRPPGVRPLVALEPTDHPLAVHQRDGIDRDELWQRVVAHLHPRPTP